MMALYAKLALFEGMQAMSYIARQTIRINFDGKVVDEDGPGASHILAFPGDVVSDEDVERFHLKSRVKEVSADGDKPQKAEAAPKEKEKAKPHFDGEGPSEADGA